MGRQPKSRKVAGITRDTKARVKAELLGAWEYAKSKAGRAESLNNHVGKLIDNLGSNMNPMELGLVLSLFAKYQFLDKHGPIASLVEAFIDYGLLKSGTEAGTLAVIGHVGLTSLPSIVNTLDVAIGGEGDVWEDFLAVLQGRAHERGDFWWKKYIKGEGGEPSQVSVKAGTHTVAKPTGGAD